ncbi:protein of unknown function [Shewanella benthica]|uniref:Uncharacterized protein n=1 Tax=Shewanella benthica TaxID=43661 RepID=A0A330M383_9GAMM|nr:protein of unknown function [Shewanella benthica]
MLLGIQILGWMLAFASFIVLRSLCLLGIETQYLWGFGSLCLDRC